jgi:hypothetical protein
MWPLGATLLSLTVGNRKGLGTDQSWALNYFHAMLLLLALFMANANTDATITYPVLLLICCDDPFSSTSNPRCYNMTTFNHHSSQNCHQYV